MSEHLYFVNHASVGGKKASPTYLLPEQSSRCPAFGGTNSSRRTSACTRVTAGASVRPAPSVQDQLVSTLFRAFGTNDESREPRVRERGSEERRVEKTPRSGVFTPYSAWAVCIAPGDSTAAGLLA